jgi:hypothetical protein
VIKRKKGADNLRPHLFHYKPEITEQNFAEVAGRIVWINYNNVCYPNSLKNKPLYNIFCHPELVSGSDKSLILLDAESSSA